MKDFFYNVKVHRLESFDIFSDYLFDIISSNSFLLNVKHLAERCLPFIVRCSCFIFYVNVLTPNRYSYRTVNMFLFCVLFSFKGNSFTNKVQSQFYFLYYMNPKSIFVQSCQHVFILCTIFING